MADDNGHSTGGNRRSPEAEDGGRIWRGLRTLLFGETEEPSLREQIEDAIDEHEEEAEREQGALLGRSSRGKTSDLSPLERQMLRNLLHFGEMTADDVSVPRADIIGIPETATFKQMIDVFVDAGHSRLPVYRDNLDEIIGMIHIRDAFAILASGKTPPKTIASLVRQPRYVPVSMGVLDLLAEMRSTRTHLAIVLDEYSGTEGIVTIEDLVEEIVGDIEDEHDDEPEALLTPLEDGLWDADARAELDDVGETISSALAEVEEDVDTLGGLAFVLAGHVPQPGEILLHDSGWRLEITEGDERRVTRLRLHPPVVQAAAVLD